MNRSLPVSIHSAFSCSNAAIRNCQLYLANAPTNTAEAKLVNERLKGLTSGPR